jgi:hypothetical protein
VSVKREIIPHPRKWEQIQSILNKQNIEGFFEIKSKIKDRIRFMINIKLQQINSNGQSISEGELKLFINCRLRYKMPIPNLNLVREVLTIIVLKSSRLRQIEFRRIFHKILKLSLPFDLYLRSHQSLFLKCAKKEQRVFISAQSPNSQTTFNNYLNENELKNHEFSLESLSKRGLE